MKKILFIMAFVAVSITLSAQNNTNNNPFGIGISSPNAQLHIHQPRAEENLLPPLPPYRGNRDEHFFDSTYFTTLLMTNPNSGSTGSDGFLLRQFNWDVYFMQQEEGDIVFQTPGGSMILSSDGRFGFGDTIATHMFNVQGTARFASDVKMTQALVVDGALTTGGNATVGGTLYATGILTVGDHLLNNGHLNVNGAAHITGSMAVDGAVTLQNTLSVTNQASVTGALSVGGNTTLNGSLTVGNGFQCDALGNLEVKHLKVTLTGWPDYVFGGSHALMPLNELESYINEYSHLPGVPSATEVEEDGADLGEMNKLLMEKVEELTLYIIDLQKQINELKSNK